MCSTVKHSVKDETKAQLLGSVLFLTLAGTGVAPTACLLSHYIYGVLISARHSANSVETKVN